ncbi:Hypothetical_protein [Hexamita inflata]|uniref:Hypothetical_protein n=1 Tax=Hexamita inflata TaxID=28002 RepID=A0AA86PX32_9EUKA|nr:Hypothetical protein HINF_LOCUS30262 [Hexamita inflata]
MLKNYKHGTVLWRRLSQHYITSTTPPDAQPKQPNLKRATLPKGEQQQVDMGDTQLLHATCCSSEEAASRSSVFLLKQRAHARNKIINWYDRLEHQHEVLREYVLLQKICGLHRTQIIFRYTHLTRPRQNRRIHQRQGEVAANSNQKHERSRRNNFCRKELEQDVAALSASKALTLLYKSRWTKTDTPSTRP